MPVIEQKTTNKNKVDFDLNRLDKSKTTIFSKYPKKVRVFPQKIRNFPCKAGKLVLLYFGESAQLRTFGRCRKVGRREEEAGGTN